MSNIAKPVSMAFPGCIGWRKYQRFVVTVNQHLSYQADSIVKGESGRKHTCFGYNTLDRFHHSISMASRRTTKRRYVTLKKGSDGPDRVVILKLLDKWLCSQCHARTCFIVPIGSLENCAKTR